MPIFFRQEWLEHVNSMMHVDRFKEPSCLRNGPKLCFYSSLFSTTSSPFVLQWYLQYVEPFTHLTIHLKWSVLYWITFKRPLIRFY